MKFTGIVPTLGLSLLVSASLGCRRDAPREHTGESAEGVQRQQEQTQQEGAGRTVDPGLRGMPGEFPRLGEPEAAEETPPGRSMRASADLESADGVEIDGEAKFTEEAGGVRVVLRVEEAVPGKKGVHIHERGDCSNITAESMGPHFAPTAEHHALPGEKRADERHLGDLGNIQVEQDGKGRLEILVPDATLQPGDAKSFLGRAIVVHAGEDVGSAEQPAGGSGTPIACGVVERES
jgi:superoxide dismutase, Cu-Zn family